MLEEVKLEDKVFSPTRTLIDSFKDRQGVDLDLVDLLTRYGKSLQAAGILSLQLEVRGKIRAAIFS